MVEQRITPTRRAIIQFKEFQNVTLMIVRYVTQAYQRFVSISLTEQSYKDLAQRSISTSAKD